MEKHRVGFDSLLEWPLSKECLSLVDRNKSVEFAHYGVVSLMVRPLFAKQVVSCKTVLVRVQSTSPCSWIPYPCKKADEEVFEEGLLKLKINRTAVRYPS